MTKYDIQAISIIIITVGVMITLIALVKIYLVN